MKLLQVKKRNLQTTMAPGTSAATATAQIYKRCINNRTGYCAILQVSTQSKAYFTSLKAENYAPSSGNCYLSSRFLKKFYQYVRFV